MTPQATSSFLNYQHQRQPQKGLQAPHTHADWHLPRFTKKSKRLVSDYEMSKDRVRGSTKCSKGYSAKRWYSVIKTQQENKLLKWSKQRTKLSNVRVHFPFHETTTQSPLCIILKQKYSEISKTFFLAAKFQAYIAVKAGANVKNSHKTLGNIFRIIRENFLACMRSEHLSNLNENLRNYDEAELTIVHFFEWIPFEKTLRIQIDSSQFECEISAANFITTGI